MKQVPMLPLKRLANFVSRGDTPKYVDSSNTVVINQACVQRDGLDLSRVKFNEDVDVDEFKGRLRTGDLLINSTGTGTLGRVCTFSAFDNRSYFADGHVTIVRDSKLRFNPKFLSMYFGT